MRRRMAIAAKVFYGGLTPSRAMFSVQPSYVVIDHSVGDGATVALTASARVFANSRFEIYRVPPKARPPLHTHFHSSLKKPAVTIFPGQRGPGGVARSMIA
jgi:hypothetical protein